MPGFDISAFSPEATVSIVTDMAGQCHLWSQKKHFVVATADGSGTLLQARKSLVEQVTPNDKLFARSRTIEQETVVLKCSDPECRSGRAVTTFTARQLRSSSDPIRVTHDVNLQCASRSKYGALHKQHTGSTKWISLATHRSANSPLCEAEFGWVFTRVAVELRQESKTADSGEKDQDGRYNVLPAQEPRRCCSDGGPAWEPGSVTLLKKAMTTSATLVSKEESSCSSTRWDTGRSVIAALPLDYADGNEACANYIAPSKSSSEKRSRQHLFSRSRYGIIHSHSCCTAGETRAVTPGRSTDERTDMQLGSVATGRRCRGPRSLEVIPVGRVAAVRTELERRMQEEKQRRMRNRSSLRAFQSAEVSDITDVEKMALVQGLTRAKWSSADLHNAGPLNNDLEQNCMRTENTSSQCTQQFVRCEETRAHTCGSLYERVNSTTSIPRSDSSRAKNVPFKQDAHAAETGGRAAFMPLPAKMQITSERETANHTVPHSSSTSQLRDRRNSECPAHQLSERSNGKDEKATLGLYRSRSCEMKTLSETENKRTACPAQKAVSFDCLPINRALPILSTDRTVKRKHRRLGKEQGTSQFASAQQAEEEHVATSSMQIYQARKCCETDETYLTVLEEKKQKTSIKKPPAQHPLSIESFPYYKAAPTSERQQLPVNIDVSEARRGPLCDAGDCDPSQHREACTTANGMVYVSSARSAMRRPPGVPRLELAKIYEARNVLHPPLKVSSSIGTPGRAPDSGLISCEKRKPHAYPSIRTEYCREAAVVRTADAYFQIDKRTSASSSSGVELVERQVTRDSLRQEQPPRTSQGLLPPARSRVVRCSPNLFTARVCTILRKQLYAAEVKASGTRDTSLQTSKLPQPSGEGVTSVKELGGPYSPAGKDLQLEAERHECLCERHSIVRTLTQYECSPLSQPKQQIESPCNPSMPSTTYWSSSTRHSSSTSLVSSCYDPPSALDAIEEQQPGQAVPVRGETPLCARTGARGTNVLRRASRTLGGPQPSCHHSFQQSKTCSSLLRWKRSDQNLFLSHSGGYDRRMNRTEGEATRRVRGSRHTAVISEPPDLVLAEPGCSPRSHVEVVRLSKQGSVTGSSGLQSNSTVCSIKNICDPVTEKSEHLAIVPTLHQALNPDAHDQQATTSCYQKHKPPRKNSAVKFCNCGSTTEKSSFLRRRRLALSRHKRSAETLLNAGVALSEVGGEIKQSSCKQYAGASFF